MSAFKTLDDLDVAGQTVLVRGDLNVPTKGDQVTDATRIERFAPTVRELAAKGAKVVVLSHFGRPKAKPDPAFSQQILVEPLAKAVGRPVRFCPEAIGPQAQAAVQALQPGEVLLLENTRFYPGEEKNDPAFVQQLAALGDLYVNDAFSAAHRAHASTEGLAHVLPAAAGRLMQGEIEALARALEHPERPVVAVVGGAKISTKLDLLTNLVQKVDILALGGGMANTFLAAAGVNVGKSLAEHDMLEQARQITATAKAAGHEILLPSDGVVAREFKAGADSHTVPVTAVPADAMMLDIGPASAATLKGRIESAKTVVWNGPLGAFEIEPFDRGTDAVAAYVAERTQKGQLLSVAGGGDTVAALAAAGVEDQFSYVSTAGGAFLEWLEGKDLPGVKALRK